MADYNDEHDDDVAPLAEENASSTEHASRARNRTIMLSPDITGQVRARMTSFERPSATAPVASATRPSLTNSNTQSEGTRQTLLSRISASANAGFANSGGGFERPGPLLSANPQASQPFAGTSNFSQTMEPPMNNQAAYPSLGAPRPVAVKKTPLVGILVSYDVDKNGEIFELRSGRITVSCEEVGPGNHLIIADESVSSMHAIIRVSSGGEIQILDQLSESGTKIKRAATGEVQELSGDKTSVENGDIISFGKRRFSLCIVNRPDEAEDTE